MCAKKQTCFPLVWWRLNFKANGNRCPDLNYSKVLWIPFEKYRFGEGPFMFPTSDPDFPPFCLKEMYADSHTASMLSFVFFCFFVIFEVPHSSLICICNLVVCICQQSHFDYTRNFIHVWDYRRHLHVKLTLGVRNINMQVKQRVARLHKQMLCVCIESLMFIWTWHCTTLKMEFPRKHNVITFSYGIYVQGHNWRHCVWYEYDINAIKAFP